MTQTTIGAPSFGEVAFVAGCGLLVLGTAVVQLFGVVGVDPHTAEIHFFLLPLFVGAFFGSLLVVIRRLRDGLSSQNVEIVRLNEKLARDLERSDRHLQTAQKGLEHGERLKVMGLLGAQVAHDLNNLLATIIGSAELIKEEATPVIAEDADMIIEAGRRAAALSDRLLSFSKPAPDCVTTDLHLAIAELAPILRKVAGRRIELRIEPGDDVPRVAADRGQIEMCLLNLVVNAKDSMEEGTITVQTSRNDRHAHLRVTDDGAGMDAATLAQAQDPFFTTKGELGTGLGLAVVHDAVERAEGRVEMQSTPGEGTSVCLHLPLESA